MKATVQEKLHYDPARECCGRQCSGELFPNLLDLEINKLNRGRVFGVLVESCGVSVQHREVVVDREAWD